MVSGIGLLIFYFINHHWQWYLAGRIGMSAMLVFTAIGHFAFPKGMAMMLPSLLPYKDAIVLITGLIELAAAVGLLLPAMYRTTGWWLILFFVAILPANISAALRQVDYQKATTNGKGPAYLWFRVPLQLFFIAWVYVCAVRA
jgi:uncharacterized membrane protein